MLTRSMRHRLIVLLALAVFCRQRAHANPAGGVVTQGGATIQSSGSQLTVTTSGNTAINWQSFNIGAGETTTFVQPTSTSVVWNQISGGSPSQIFGTLNANGYVILQNAAGIYIGGQACINTHGLLLTTAPLNMPNLSSGGAWQFDAPPPLAKIINCGQINIAGGGSAFLLAADIENNGTISAPGGNIGLYAGEKVLVSMSPDGRSLSSVVTLPEGSVDNEGKLIADAGSIAAQAQTVNQNGLVQANSVQNINGTIELVASENLSLGANSAISAQGDSQGVSAGGNVTLKSGGSFADQAGSAINTAGSAQGGDGGNVEISAPEMSSIQSSVEGQAAAGYLGGVLTIDPYNIQLVSSGGTTSSSGTVNAGDPPPTGTLVLNVNSFASFSTINLQAVNNIELSTGLGKSVNTPWTLANSSAAATLTLSAGNSINFDNNSGIVAGKNWTLNLMAGTALASGSVPAALTGGIYLNGNSYLQTQNGDLNLSAYNTVVVNSGAVRTLGGGGIDVTTQYGDVNTGTGTSGYTFAPHSSVVSKQPPYYTVNSTLSGISTAAGGDVTITAGGNVISYLPTQSQYATSLSDPGTGAFGSQPGNVTITAGGNVYGNYVVANGVGTVTAGGNIGVPLTAANQNNGFALSLINGSWNISAPHGSIYVQDIVNPNGVFGEGQGATTISYPGYHYFDYGLQDSVSLNAGDSVEITGYNAPQTPASGGGAAIPIILPPELSVTTGTGDFTLDTSVILFPSPDQSLNLNIGGSFIGVPNGNPINLEMSDSAAKNWIPGDGSFGVNDHSTAPPEINNPDLVNITVAGDMDDINLYADMAATLKVGGDLNNSGFVGQNLHATDATTISVAGQIYNSPLYSFVALNSAITSANPLQPGAWDSFFELAINPALLSQLENINVLAAKGGNSLVYYLQQYLLFPSGATSLSGSSSNPGFVYDPSSNQLGFKGNMSTLTAAQINLLSGLNANGSASATPGVFTVLKVDAQGNPITDAQGHLEFATYTFTPYQQIAGANGLYAESLNDSSATTPALGYQIGGPGTFTVTAGSMNLGNSPGIQSFGFGGEYSYLEAACGVLNSDGTVNEANVASGGAAVNVNVAGDLDMITSAIDSQDGGDVNVNVGGALNLSQGNFNFNTVNCYGIYTSGHSDVNVTTGGKIQTANGYVMTAGGDINIGSARIAAFDGGSVSVVSGHGDVNAGNGANQALLVYGFYLSPATGLPTYVEFGDLTDAGSLQYDPAPFGSGILAEAPTKKYWTPGGTQDAENNPIPGNITVEAAYGNITSSLGGISQIALHATGTPTVVLNSGSLSLSAGTTGVAATDDQGNIDVSVVIGVNVSVKATGKANGIFVSHQNLDLTAQSFSGVGLAGGQANVSVSQAGDSPAIVVGIGGVDATGLGSSATLLGQNVSVDGAAGTSTLGSSASATSTSQAAAQQSNQAAQQVASTDTGSGDDQDKKKKPALSRVKRVTVILPDSNVTERSVPKS